MEASPELRVRSPATPFHLDLTPHMCYT
jgi:hypothetical protein